MQPVIYRFFPAGFNYFYTFNHSLMKIIFRMNQPIWNFSLTPASWNQTAFTKPFSCLSFFLLRFLFCQPAVVPVIIQNQIAAIQLRISPENSFRFRIFISIRIMTRLFFHSWSKQMCRVGKRFFKARSWKRTALITLMRITCWWAARFLQWAL